MIQSLYQSTDFVESEIFSAYTMSQLIFVFGCDKDTEHTSMLLRMANRARSNSSNHVSTLAMYENAMENHENLSKTILKKEPNSQACPVLVVVCYLRD